LYDTIFQQILWHSTPTVSELEVILFPFSQSTVPSSENSHT